MLSQRELLALHKRMTDVNKRVHVSRARLNENLAERKEANDAFDRDTDCKWDTASVYALGVKKSIGWVNVADVGDAKTIIIVDEKGVTHLYEKEFCQDFNVDDSRGNLFWFNEIPVVAIKLKRHMGIGCE